MRRGWFRFHLLFTWDWIKNGWVAARWVDRIGVVLLSVALIAAGVIVLNRGAWRNDCSGQVLILQQAFLRSDEAVREASDADQAGRCSVYRDRATLLAAALHSACYAPAKPEDRFANADAERRFYDRLIAAKCGRPFDPSCSGPACFSSVDGG